MRTKRGISPLISAVLLIGFSVALAAVVSTFVIQKTKDFDVGSVVSSSYCEEVVLGIGVQGPTFNPDALSLEDPNLLLLQDFSLANKGAFTIRQLSYTAPGLSSIEYSLVTPNPNPFDEPIPAPILSGESSAWTFSYPESAEEEDLFKFTPWIQDPETMEYVPCEAQQLVVSYATVLGLSS